MAALPGLQWLDGKEVSKSERILSTQVYIYTVYIYMCMCIQMHCDILFHFQKYEQLREKILVQQKVYEAKRVRRESERW